MDKNEYLELVKKLTPKENKARNYLLAFIMGGFIGVLGEVLKLLFKLLFNLTTLEASSASTLLIIFCACLFTGLGFFDNLVSKFKCGLIIPTTGFAHSVASAALDYKKDGLITGLGSNFFKLAGSVILYGIVSGFIMGIVKVIINV